MLCNKIQGWYWCTRERVETDIFKWIAKVEGKNEVKN